MKEFKRQDKPRPGDEGDVEEADEVAQQAGDQHLQPNISFLRSGGNCRHLDMPIFGDELEAVEICAHLGDVVDHGSDAKDGWMSTIVLHINKTQLQQIQIQIKIQPKIHIDP